ncbi:TIGR03089 family protein [Mobilicoccus caccae]|uniref:TIGR03089 family protein n=1 Tax=Mobilicoccus caccae TaxID=1859295 RepID=A0ABQ6IM15_9MICO|nr:TIGR03089 family protein [Mobilicoccus caccae]GMA38963.1 TIGR03089 family protein [Mobilicoccus caccae]
MPAAVRPDSLVSLLRSGESARPRLIWYAPGERIELSGRVLATWASKVADLLQEDLDAEVGTRVLLVGAPHWRLLAWALGTWTLGATVVVDESGESATDVTAGIDVAADIVVADGSRIAAGEFDTTTPDAVVALTRAALARTSPVALPPGVIDEAAVLLTYADEMEPYDSASADDPAVTGSIDLTYGELVSPASDARVHLSASLPLPEVLRAAASTWAAGGSIVLTDPQWEAEQGGDPGSGAFADVLASEGVSAPRD